MSEAPVLAVFTQWAMMCWSGHYAKPVPELVLVDSRAAVKDRPHPPWPPVY